MKKGLVGGLAVTAVLLVGLFAGAARATEGGNFDCSEAWSLCAEPESSIGYDGAYTGHDEPSLLFYSNRAGAGNSNLYQFTLPGESRVMTIAAVGQPIPVACTETGRPWYSPV